MGATMATLGGTSYVSCKKDADCYAASTTPVTTALTTTADKAKACCVYYETTKLPSGTAAQITAGKAAIAANVVSGLPVDLNKYTKFCVRDYPSTITSFSTAPSAYDAKTGVKTNAAADGGNQFKFYCDGGATTLAVAVAATAAVSVSFM